MKRKICLLWLAILAACFALVRAATLPAENSQVHKGLGGPTDYLGFELDYLQQLRDGSSVATLPDADSQVHKGLGGVQDYLGFACDYLQDIRDASLGAGVDWKQNVRAATTGPITISTGLNNGDSLDGLTLATGDRVLVKDQAAGAENGIYVVAASPARATDADTWAEITGSAVVVNAGTVNASKLWINGNVAGGTLDTTAITYSEISGTSADTASYGAIRWSAAAATSNAAGTPIKLAGTTAAQGTASADVTQGTANRLTYTGTDDKDFYVVANVTVTAAADTAATYYLTEDGSPITGAVLTRAIAGTGAELVTISCMVTLSTNQYVELWCATADGDDLTVASGTLAIFTTGAGGGGVPSARTITVAGTANEITSSAGAQDLSANRTWTLSLPTALTFTGKTVTGGTINATTITGAAGAVTLDASGFNGNLAVTDNTLQEVAQKLDDLTAAGGTNLNDIGDATADGSVAQAGFEMDFTSTLDSAGKAIWTITNTDADTAADTAMLDLRHNDGADANVFYMRLIGDNDGTPTNDFLFSQAGLTSTKPFTASDFTATGQSYYINSGQTVSWKAGTGSPEAAVTAGIGSIWSQTDGTTDTALWRKETGVGNTGWVAVAAGGGGTTITSLGDATADGSIAQAGFEIDFTSTLDSAGKAIWTITNTDADTAADTAMLDLRHNDGADANVFYLRAVGDNDGTPTTDFSLSQTALSVGSGVASTFSGSVTGTGTWDLSAATVTLGTITTLPVTTIELGHASDTTLARSGAGAITVEGTAVLLSGGALGTPASGTVTNLTGTASININGTVGATTPGTGAFTTLSASSLLSANANLTVANGATTAGVLKLMEDSDAGANFATFQVPALAANTVYTLPADDGDAGEQLQTDGSGNLTWEAAGAGGGAVATDTIFDAAGDLVVGTGSNTAARLAVGEFGSKLTSDGTTAFWDTLSTTIELKEEFFTSANTIDTPFGYGGTLNAAFQYGDASHWGVIRFRSTGADQYLFTGTGVETVQLGAGVCYVEWILKTPGAASNGTDTYTIIAGLGDSTGGAAQTDGVYFRYTHSVNAGKWERVTESNTSEEAVDTTVAFAADTWVRLGFKVTNAADVEFFINGSSVGTNTTDANIPNGSARVLSPLWVYDRTAGTTETDMFIDAFRMVFKPSTPR